LFFHPYVGLKSKLILWIILKVKSKKTKQTKKKTTTTKQTSRHVYILSAHVKGGERES
jgi:hypothetical protein